MATYTGKVEVNGAVKRGTLHLRQNAADESSSLALIPDGEVLQLTTIGNEAWFRTTYNNKSGYVAARYIVVTDEGFPVYRVATQEGVLNIRNTPSTGGLIVFTAPKEGGLYKLEEKSDWYRVSCDLGTGWAKKNFLVADGSAQITGFLTPDEYIENLERYCNSGWSYNDDGDGYNSSKKSIDCAYYPFKARNSLGEHAATLEYDSILTGEKGKISSFDQLEKGMEVFQGTEKTKEHMGVYAGIVTIKGVTCHGVYQSRSKSGDQLAQYKEETGPNLTEMNDQWNYWAWSPYVIH